MRRKKNDRYVKSLADYFARFDAVHPSCEKDIHQHKVRLELSGAVYGVLAVPHGPEHLISHGYKPILQLEGDQALIFNNEYPLALYHELNQVPTSPGGIEA
jgi:hypothetical protein